MARKAKLTGFSRFLIVMLFVAPMAYIGASYYNGEDGVQKIKELLNINTTSTTNSEKESTITISDETVAEKASEANEANDELKELVDILKEEVKELKAENKELKATLYEKEQLIKEFQEQ